MDIKLSKLYTFLFLLLSSLGAAQTNYYVDSVNGSDSNNCLAPGTGHACLTISHAESLSAAGDTINMAAGTYRLSTAYNSNTGRIVPKANQTFTGPSCTPTSAQCTAVVTGGREIGSLATLDGGTGYYKVTGMTQAGYAAGGYTCDTGWDGCNYPEDMFFDNVPIQHVKCVTAGCNSGTPPTLTTGQWWFDYTNDVIWFYDNPSGHTVETSVLSTMFAPTNVNNITIQNLTIKEFASELQQGGGIDPQYGQTASPSFATGWVIQNSYVTLNHSNGLRAGFGMSMLNNVIDTNGQLGVGGGLPTGTGSTPSNYLIKGNTVTNNNFAHISPGFGAGGIKIGNSLGVVVKNNIVSNNLGNGIHGDVNTINLTVDGNIIQNNQDTAATGGQGTGLIDEISNGKNIFRNNRITFTGNAGAYGIHSSTSEGVEAYCNVVEEPNTYTNTLWQIGASNRGNVTVAPNPDYCSAWPATCYQTSRNNYFHHNTFIWDTGATGSVGYLQNDTTNQPTFFALNTPPDYNWYHASTAVGSWTKFRYDNNNSGSNTLRIFTSYQGQGADAHGTYDNVNSSGYPAVSISSPADQSSYNGSTTVTATASDGSGISKVEFYVDWGLVASDTSAPYSFTVGGATGTHTVAALAYANSGVKACYAVTLTNTGTSPSAPKNLMILIGAGPG